MASGRSIVAGIAISLCLSVQTLAQDRPTDEWLTNPVDRATFEAYVEFFTYGTDVPFETEVLETTTNEGVLEEHLRFQSTPGVVVTARLYHPAGIELGDAPATVFVHGGGMRGKDAAYIVNGTRLHARAGVAVLTIDMAHYGERDDGFLASGSEQDKHERLYNNEAVYLDWVQQTVKDIRRAFDFLVSERGVDSERIGLTGLSRGAVLATIAGAAEERFGAVALLHGGHFDFFEDGHRPAACPANYISRIAPRPLFSLSSETDADFLPETAILPMHRLAGQPHTIMWSDGGHGAITRQEHSAIAEWLREHLR